MKKILFFLLIVFSTPLYAYRIVPSAGYGVDQVGAQASRDVTIICSAGQILVSSGAGNWSCGPTAAVRVDTGNGFGSTNTRIRIYSNTITNTSGDIVYATDSTNGASFTIRATGYYCMTVSDSNGTGGGMSVGASLNSNHLTAGIETSTLSNDRERLAFGASNAAFVGSGGSFCGNLASGDVVRPHMGGTISAPSTGKIAAFEISRVR